MILIFIISRVVKNNTLTKLIGQVRITLKIHFIDNVFHLLSYTEMIMFLNKLVNLFFFFSDKVF